MFASNALSRLHIETEGHVHGMISQIFLQHLNIGHIHNNYEHLAYALCNNK